MNEYEIILNDPNNSAKAVVARNKAREAGKIAVIVGSEATAQIFRELIEKFEPEEQVLDVFRMGFADNNLTRILNYMVRKQINSLNDIRPEKYVNDIFDIANLLSGDLRDFFLTEFRFAFERINKLNSNVWVIMNNILIAFDERISKEKPISASVPVTTNTGLVLSSQRGAKTDLIRIINAMYEIGFFHNEVGQIPTKEVLMKKVGDFLGIDLSKYDVNLSESLQYTEKANLEIFDKLRETHKKIWQSKQELPDTTRRKT